ncbi:MAG: Type I Restriction Enzyme [Microgenomates group bacterium GW2011_GWC1_39_7b]|nr:MAG: Type I Restriction Enzyme [Microgenomates group bacterium GW2011_GWC1_39_7b]KKR73909.1 MAG: Type I Restriction Enzyme [Candidatus Woesebacteria bacterium GW2011_GWA2_40_7]KKS90727.1 MAG: Type I Restriction Enzyme [Candidatus Woesebacteria bacterium GW2011_GWA1_43_12]
MDTKLNSEIINKIFKNPEVQYGLTEFENIKPSESLDIFEKEKGRFFLKCLKRNIDLSIWNEEKQIGEPEEIVRQLWLFKLTKFYNYPLDRIAVEKEVNFGREVREKAADIVVYKEDKETPQIIIEVKSPEAKDGIEQIKSYLNAEGAPIGVLSNGIVRVILYRPYPHNFENTLRDIPRVDQTIEDVQDAKLTLDQLEKQYDLVKIIKVLEELVLAGAGVDSFNEIFKLIYAKLYDEKYARDRKGELLFRQSTNPQVTYDNIERLFESSTKEWPGMFVDGEKIQLSPSHLSVCVGQLEKVKLLDADLGIIDRAFEYLLPDVAKGKKGQYFTPRHVIDMAVKMLNPKEDEYVIDPASGSGGFLIHAMQWIWDNFMSEKSAETKSDFARKHIYGIDFDDKPVKISRALMLIAGDGRSHIFRLNSLNPQEWKGDDSEKLRARAELLERLHKFNDYDKDRNNQDNFKFFDFDVVLTNPPFAGEIRERQLLNEYELAKNDKGKLKDRSERHILFIERALNLVKPGGRLAIVLPQGVLNNTNMSYIRSWLFDKARILAVVGLNVNTFKPHTGTKTSVLFLQKWEEKQEVPKDYPIFMAVSKKSGKDNSGDYVYKKDEEGQIVTNPKGDPAVDHDLDEIADKFIEFAKNEGFGFWK